MADPPGHHGVQTPLSSREMSCALLLRALGRPTQLPVYSGLQKLAVRERGQRVFGPTRVGNSTLPLVSCDNQDKILNLSEPQPLPYTVDIFIPARVVGRRNKTRNVRRSALCLAHKALTQWNSVSSLSSLLPQLQKVNRLFFLFKTAHLVQAVS